MSWLKPYSLGLAGYELPLMMQVLSFSMDHNNVEAQAMTVLGDLRRSIIKVHVPVIALETAALTEAVMARLRGLRNSQDLLNLKCKSAFTVTDQICIASTSGTVILPNMSASGVTIAGVYLATDIHRTGTNYFTSGSYDAASRMISLGADLPADNSEVVVDFSFTGHTVLMTKLVEMPHEGQYQDLWKASMELTGA